MFAPKYTITNQILKNVGAIDAAKEVVDSADLLVSWEDKIKQQAQLKSTHHSTRLEGNRVEEEQVKELLEGKEILAALTDIQELLNYAKVLAFVDSVYQHIGKGRPYIFTLETLQEIHRLAMYKILQLKDCGEFRTKQVVLKNAQTGEVGYTPPPAVEIPYLMEDLINWINQPETKELHPIIKAGLVHYEIGRIHPFLDGNGRVARAVTLLLLYLDGYDFRQMFCLDEYYDQDSLKYYLTMQAVSNQMVLDTHERDITPWLDYFVEGAKVQLVELKDKVKRVSTDSQVKDKLGEKIQLTERQMIIMEYLYKNRVMRNSDFRKIFPDLSDDTVLREIKMLKQKSLVKKVGGTKRAQYMLNTTQPVPN